MRGKLLITNILRRGAIITTAVVMALSVYGQTDRINGVTMVAPPQQWETAPTEGIERLNADWVGVVPYGYTRPGSTEVRYDLPWQWWGERKDGAEASIRMAHDSRLKVLLKPQVYVPGGWVGDTSFDTEAEWQAWQASYRAFILDWARLAEHLRVDMLCIATEYKKAVQQRPDYWRQLIKEIKMVYSGALTYSSNWDGYDSVPFWGDLDYIGISAYFPLSDSETPTVAELQHAWKPVVKQLAKFSRRQKKQILFTEYGYMSVDGCAGKAWLIEKDIDSRSINQVAQANAYSALLSTMVTQPWWAGGFLWKYFPHGQGHEGYPEKDYTPQDKKAEHIVAYWYASLPSDSK